MATTLETEYTAAGIICRHRDGAEAGRIDYTPADDEAGRPESLWTAVPAEPVHPSMARVAFLSREAAEFFILAMAAEARAMARA